MCQKINNKTQKNDELGIKTDNSKNLYNSRLFNLNLNICTLCKHI